MDIIICKTDKELKKAIKKGERMIKVVDATLAKRISIVMNIPPGGFKAGIACAVLAISLVHTGVILLPADVPTTGGAGSAILFGSAGAAAVPVVTIVGVGPAIALIGLGAALGGTSVLRRLYSGYKIKEKGSGYIILQKK